MKLIAVLWVILLLLSSLTPTDSDAATYNFESNSSHNLLEQYLSPYNSDIKFPYSYRVVTAPSRSGCYSARFEVRKGDCGYRKDCDGEDNVMNRAELSEESFYLSRGTSAYYGFSVLIPDEMKNTDDWRLITQWHSDPNEDNGETWESPILACRFAEGNIFFTKSYHDNENKYVGNTIIHTIENVERNKWHDFVVHLIWSPDQNGLVELWHDQDVKFSDIGNIGLNHTGKGVYWKFGIYRTEVDDSTDVVYFDELRRGETHLEVLPHSEECSSNYSFNNPLQLLLLNNGGIIKNDRPYRPNDKNPASSSETPVQLKENFWQRLYGYKETFCQMSVKSDDTVKTKFGQLVDDGSYGRLEWFDVQRGTPHISMQNGAPFDVDQVFPEYSFSNCHNPGDDDDIWTCLVQIPGYRPFSPTMNNPASFSENPVQLNENSWQRLHSYKETFCQMSVKSDDTVKTKFGQLVDDGSYGRLEWFDVQRGTLHAPMQNGAPFDVDQAFPEYSFSNCHNPGDDDDIWSCLVQIPSYREP